MPNIHELLDSYFDLVGQTKDRLNSGVAEREQLIEEFERIADAAREENAKLGHHWAEACQCNVALLSLTWTVDDPDHEK